jgi:hypothetical protein
MAAARPYWSTLPRDPAADGFTPANWLMDPLHMRAAQGEPNLPWSKYPPALVRHQARVMPYSPYGEYYLGASYGYAPHPFFAAGLPLPGSFRADEVGAPWDSPARHASVAHSANPKRVMSLRRRLESIGREIHELRAAGLITRARASFCAQCGTRAAKTANFCINCGASVKSAATQDSDSADGEGSGPDGVDDHERFDADQRSGLDTEKDAQFRRNLRIAPGRGAGSHARDEQRGPRAPGSRVRKGGPQDATEHESGRGEKSRRSRTGAHHTQSRSPPRIRDSPGRHSKPHHQSEAHDHAPTSARGAAPVLRGEDGDHMRGLERTGSAAGSVVGTVMPRERDVCPHVSFPENHLQEHHLHPQKSQEEGALRREIEEGGNSREHAVQQSPHKASLDPDNTTHPREGGVAAGAPAPPPPSGQSGGGGVAGAEGDNGGRASDGGGEAGVGEWGGAIEEQARGEQLGAVKPWTGTLKAFQSCGFDGRSPPDTPPDEPASFVSLEHVFGTRGVCVCESMCLAREVCVCVCVCVCVVYAARLYLL